MPQLNLIIALSLVIVGTLIIVLLLLWIKNARETPKDLIYSPISEPKYISVDDLTIHYIQEGAGQDLVLIHGIGASVYFWRTLFHVLKKYFRVTAVDLPGFGLSDKPLDKEFSLDAQTRRITHMLDQLGIQNFHLVGHSMGGAIATWIAKTQPNRVKKLVLMAPALEVRMFFFSYYLLQPLVHILKHFIVTPSLVKRIFLRASHVQNSSPDFNDTILQYYYPYFKNPSAVVTFYKSLQLLLDQRLVTGELKLKINSIYLINGKEDRIIGHHRYRKFLNENPQCKLIQLNDCGHLVTEENPQELIDIFKNIFDIPSV